MAETTPTTAKERLAKEAEGRKQSIDDAVKRMEQSQPTPTQEENDLARLGEPVMEKEDDGSGPEIIMTMQAKPVTAATTEAKPAPAAAAAPKSTTPKPSTSSGSGSSSS